ncbi:MAG: 3-methyl-2-oxobutanoate hydroxymethyltransferase, partial [Acidobacteriota bacterium]|nr:3-methyl-2-oxobutanoate hydroxymethyltransferase [Acidobacteriota bacterium]
LSFGRLPRFVRQYADIRETMTEAITNWMNDVKNGNYPSEKESYGLPKDIDAASLKTKIEPF